jgi:hypothetical protein
MSDKRYQVFVSSTYTDLKDERGRIMKTLMEMGCIPAGMEFFTAMDEETFEFIKTVIDLSDFYLLIIANRYGSLAPDDISYTEKEYDYAVSKGLKVVALIHDNPESVSFDKSEESPAARKKLAAFRAKVKGKGTRIVKPWTKPEELPGFVALSVQAAINRYPAVGWVRANQVASTEILTELNDVRKENEGLKAQLAKVESRPIVENLAALDEPAPVRGIFTFGNSTKEWALSPSWRELFAWLSPRLYEPKREDEVGMLLTKWARSHFDMGPYDPQFAFNGESFQTLKLQFIALNLITVRNDVGSPYWFLSASGERMMFELRTIKLSNIQPPETEPGEQAALPVPAPE